MQRLPRRRGSMRQGGGAWRGAGRPRAAAGRGRPGARLPQGMMTSACLRLGATNMSKAGLTNLVYCSITPAMSRPRIATSRCILRGPARARRSRARGRPASAGGVCGHPAWAQWWSAGDAKVHEGHLEGGVARARHAARKSCARRGFHAARVGRTVVAARAPSTLPGGGCIRQPPAPLSRAPACQQGAGRGPGGGGARGARKRAGAPPGEAQVVVGVHKHLHVEAAAERLHVQDQDALRAVVHSLTSSHRVEGWCAAVSSTGLRSQGLRDCTATLLAARREGECFWPPSRDRVALAV